MRSKRWRSKFSIGSVASLNLRRPSIKGYETHFLKISSFEPCCCPIRIAYWQRHLFVVFLFALVPRTKSLFPYTLTHKADIRALSSSTRMHNSVQLLLRTLFDKLTRFKCRFYKSIASVCWGYMVLYCNCFPSCFYVYGAFITWGTKH